MEEEHLRYVRVDTVDGALAALERPGATLYAGGTDLLVALRHASPWTTAVRELVDIKGVSSACGVTDQGATLRVGALVTGAELENDALVTRFAPALADAATETSAPMLRARGTVGGNLLTPHPTPDVAAVLMALGAHVHVATALDRIEVLSVEEVLDSRGGDGAGNVTWSSAMILAVEVPKGPENAFIKLGTRQAFCRTGTAVALSVRGGTHRVVLSGVAERPYVARAVSAALDGGDNLTAAIDGDLQQPDSGREIQDPGRRTRPNIVEGLIRAARARAASRVEDLEPQG